MGEICRAQSVRSFNVGKIYSAETSQATIRIPRPLRGRGAQRQGAVILRAPHRHSHAKRGNEEERGIPWRQGATGRVGGGWEPCYRRERFIKQIPSSYVWIVRWWIRYGG